jgi:hypothetical protein
MKRLLLSSSKQYAIIEVPRRNGAARRIFQLAVAAAVFLFYSNNAVSATIRFMLGGSC